MTNTISKALLDYDDTAIQAVDVPQWPDAKGKLFVRTLDGMAADGIIRLLDNGTSEIDRIIGIVLLTVCDENGNRVFKADDKLKLKTKSLTALRVLVEAAISFNGLDAEEPGKNQPASRSP